MEPHAESARDGPRDRRHKRAPIGLDHRWRGRRGQAIVRFVWGYGQPGLYWISLGRRCDRGGRHPGERSGSSRLGSLGGRMRHDSAGRNQESNRQYANSPSPKVGGTVGHESTGARHQSLGRPASRHSGPNQIRGRSRTLSSETSVEKRLRPQLSNADRPVGTPVRRRLHRVRPSNTVLTVRRTPVRDPPGGSICPLRTSRPLRVTSPRSC